MQLYLKGEGAGTGCILKAGFYCENRAQFKGQAFLVAIQMWSAGLIILAGRLGADDKQCARVLAPPPALTEQLPSIILVPFVSVAPVTYAVQLKNDIFVQFSTEIDTQAFQKT